jgi:hypothetical protein
LFQFYRIEIGFGCFTGAKIGINDTVENMGNFKRFDYGLEPMKFDYFEFIASFMDTLIILLKKLRQS